MGFYSNILTFTQTGLEFAARPSRRRFFVEKMGEKVAATFFTPGTIFEKFDFKVGSSL